MLYLPKKGMAFYSFRLVRSVDQSKIAQSQKSMPDLNASQPHFDEPEPDLC